MTLTPGAKTHHCGKCDVWEGPGLPNRMKILTEAVFDGMIVAYIDHGTEHWPSPA